VMQKRLVKKISLLLAVFVCNIQINPLAPQTACLLTPLVIENVGARKHTVWGVSFGITEFDRWSTPSKG
jgi:hypothetical protein